MNEQLIGAVFSTGIIIVVLSLLIALATFETKCKIKQKTQLPVMRLDGVEYYSTKYNLTPHYRNENGNVIIVTCKEKQ